MFVIIKSKTYAFGEVGATWGVVTSPYKPARNITEEQAKEAIKRYGLVCALHNRDGKVYDTPEQDFRRAFAGHAKRAHLWECDEETGFRHNSTNAMFNFLDRNL